VAKNHKERQEISGDNKRIRLEKIAGKSKYDYASPRQNGGQKSLYDY
jgi:hypothetical protein